MAKNKADYFELKEHLLKKIIDSQCITFRTSVASGPSDDLRPSLTWSMENWHILLSFRGKAWKFIFTSRHRQGSVNKLLDGWSSIRWEGWCAIVHYWAKVIGKPDVSLVPGFQYSAVFLIRLEMFEYLKITWQIGPPCPSQYFPTRSWHACPDQFWDENNHLPFIAVIYLDCSCQKPNVWRSSCKTTPWWRQPGPREITWDVFLLFRFKTQLLEKPGVHLIDQQCCSSPWNISHLYQGKDFVVYLITYWSAKMWT